MKDLSSNNALEKRIDRIEQRLKIIDDQIQNCFKQLRELNEAYHDFREKLRDL